MTHDSQPIQHTHGQRRGRAGIASLSALADVLPAASYALWALIGATLALDVELEGRGEILVQLALGLTLLVAGMLAASARRPLWPLWRSLAMPAPLPPTRERLLAVVTLLPMLGVAGLARGDNSFWATRLLGGVLALTSLGTLLIASARAGHRQTGETGSATDTFLAALFCGGLWFWTCLLLQRPHHAESLVEFLLLGLLVIGLTTALARRPASRGRRMAALLAFVVPCLALVVASTHRWQVPMAVVAVLSSTLGLCIDAALAHLDRTARAVNGGES